MTDDDLSVIINDDTETIRVDPVTGTVETDQPDGSVVVHLDKKKDKTEEEENGWFANLADDMGAGELAKIGRAHV